VSTCHDPRSAAVSLLAAGPGGWRQRVNFVAVGVASCTAAADLRRESTVAPLSPALLAATGIGLIGSGAFVPSPADAEHGESAGTATVETLHNPCALPSV
jgi:hypothetical protein